MDGGGTRVRDGSGSRSTSGDRRGFRGEPRRAMSAGVRWGSTIGPCSPCPSRPAMRGPDGWRCRAGGSGRTARSCTARPCPTAPSATPFVTQAHAPVAAPLAARSSRARSGNVAAYRLGAPAPNQSRTRAPGTVIGQRSTLARPSTPSLPIASGGGRPLAASRNPQQSATSSSQVRSRQGSMPRVAAACSSALKPSMRRGAQPPGSSPGADQARSPARHRRTRPSRRRPGTVPEPA